jgi:uncharacterized protein (TIGR03437 family)
MKTISSLALLLVCVWSAGAQPVASPTSLTFSYQVNSTTLPAAQKLTVTLPATAGASTVMAVQVLSNPVGSTPPGWLAVTPDNGRSPLALLVTVNPTSLAPGTYSGIIKVTTSPSVGTTSVTVNLAVSTAPSSLLLTAPPSQPALSDTAPKLSFAYTTGDSATIPLNLELDVASNGGIIPFTVTAAASSGSGSGSSKTPVWVRVNVPGQLPAQQTSGVALSGSYVPITVTIDPTTLATLDVGVYTQVITIKANDAASGNFTVVIELSIAAGPPKLDSVTPIFPASVVAAPAVDPVITIYGDNFFTTTSVFLTPDGGSDQPFVPKYLSRKVLQITVGKALFALPGLWTLKVMNGNKDTGPQIDSTRFTVTDPAQPVISSVLNAASYLKTASQTGASPNPVPPTGTGTSVAPREIISIFGQHLGPPDITPAPVTPGFPDTYPTDVDGVQVLFRVGLDPAAPAIPARLIMVSNAQVNAIVPVAVNTAIGTAGPNATVQVVNGALSTDPFPVTVVAEDPGIFTFGGLGTGQAAVLNYDVTTGYTINGSKAPSVAAARNSTIVIYATGLGDFAGGTTVTVTDSSSPAQSATALVPITINSTPAATGVLTVTGLVPDGAANVNYPATTLVAQGGTPPYKWIASGVPPGLALTGAVLAGRPTTAGAFNMTVTVTDSSSPALTATSTYTINITMTALPLSLPNGVVGVAYPSTTLQAYGGTAPYTFSSTTLPPGVTLSAAGVLGGSPTTAGTYPVSIAVQDSAGTPHTMTVNFSVTIAAAIVISTTTLPDGVPNLAYTTTTLQALGGTAPYIWTALSVLPAGLTLSTGGVLSGTPTVPGAFTVDLQVADSTSLSATATLTLTIGSLAIINAPLPDGTANVPYTATALQASGGTPPYRWTAVGLPAGLSLNATTGVISGTPLAETVLPLPDGAVALGAVSVADSTYRVTIDGQSAVVPYVGTSKGSVAGLVQINAVVPATARTGAAIPLTVTVGGVGGARTSQLGVTLAVK